MEYTVLWRPSAERQLAELWVEAEDRNLVTNAADRIDGVLGEDPERAGESRTPSRRILIIPPLAVYFEVLPEDRKAYVTAVWQWR